MADQEKIEFEFLKDSPITQNNGDLFDFYHGIVSPALKDILESKTCTHTIGLFSRWGTGKSTIIEMMQGDLETPMFIFDAWKYQDDSLRRIFLIKLVDFLIEKGEKIDRSILSPLYKGTEERQEITIAPDPDAPSKKWWQKTWDFIKKNWLFLIGIILVVIWVILDNKFGDRHIVLETIKNFAAVVGSFSLLAVVFKPIIEKTWQQLIDNFISSLTPVAALKTKIEREERLNSPEQFEKLFQDIIKAVDKKIIIVFDNIDRVQGDVAIRILTTVKTFLDPISTAGLVFVVPCDSEAIAKQIKNYYGKDDDGFDSSEYLRKLFNVIIWTPEFIDTDLQSFTEGELKKTGKVAYYISGEDVALVINSAYSNNPRQIKQFINNLIAAVVTASKTGVWETIKLNIPYLAKVLVLKEKFPDAYKLLKEKWYDPQNIFKEEDNTGLKDFMRKTSRITTPNAEPFIYFKEPVISAQLSRSNEIRQNLIEGNKEESATFIAAEQNKNAIGDFVCDLLTKYRHQQEVLLKVFDTHLHVFHDSEIKSSKKGYYDCMAGIIDGDLWQSYLVLPTELIFSDILESNLLDTGLKKRVVDRYRLALGDDAVKKNLDVAKSIITSFKEHSGVLTEDDRVKIAQALEQNYAAYLEVMCLFQDTASQKMFITKEAFTRFVTTIEQKNIAPSIPVVLQFRDYINAHGGLLAVVIQRMADLLQQEFTGHPEARPEKDQLMRHITEILGTFKDGLPALSTELKENLVSQLIQTMTGMSVFDNQWICVESLQLVYPIATPDQQEKITTQTGRFFNEAKLAFLENALDSIDVAYNQNLIEQFLPQIQPRFVSDTEVLAFIYKKSNDAQKAVIINYLIDNQPDNGITFLTSLGNEIPERVQIIKYLLSKLESVQIQNRVDAYNFLPTQIKRNDPEEIKVTAVTQIKEMLKSNDFTVSKIGYDFFIHCEFLGYEKRGEVAGEVLTFLREPGTTITSVNLWSLSAISHCYEKLHDTVKKDFVYTLFDNLRPEKDRATLETLVEVLDEVKPTYSTHKTDFDYLLDRLKTWSAAEEDKRLIVEHISKFKSPSPKKEERDYWLAIETLMTGSQES